MNNTIHQWSDDIEGLRHNISSWLPERKVPEVLNLCLGGPGVPEGPGVSQGLGMLEQTGIHEAGRYLDV